MTATSTAGVAVNNNPRRPLELTVIEDGSGSFVQEWSNAITSDFGLYALVNGAEVTGDMLGMVVFDEGLNKQRLVHVCVERSSVRQTVHAAQQGNDDYRQ